METVTEYKSLNDIRTRKEMLRNAISKDDEKIRTLWNELFKPTEIFNKNTPPSKRISRILNTGATVIDGAILGWKLYRKFRR